MNINWNTVYLLGWHSADGKKNLTAWHGNHPWVDVVVVGANDNDMAHIMWNAPLHKDFQLIKIPPLTNRLTFAKMSNGLHAFGWYMEEGINRPPMKPLKDEWAWFKQIKGELNG